MKMSAIVKGQSVLASVCMIAIVIVLCGCPASEEKKVDRKEPVVKKTEPKTEPTAKKAVKPIAKAEPVAKSSKTVPAESEANLEAKLGEELVEIEKNPRDLGPPLVDYPDQLVRLSPDQPIWMDKKNKHVVLLGEVCEPGHPLEFFASNVVKAYESVVSVNVTPSFVHAGLEAVGAKPGQPARFELRFSPPTGMEIAIEVRWKDKDNKVQSAPAQHWIRNIKTNKELDVNWVFCGSGFYTNEETGKRRYLADPFDLICVSSMPSAMLDLPMHSAGAIEDRMFEAFKEHLPPAGTPTTILLKPIFDKKSADKPGVENSAKKAVPAVDKKITEAEQEALEAAQTWLSLIDGDQYTRGWETAAKRLNVTTPRREFIRTLNETRKPLGKVKSRKLISNKYTRSIPNGPDGQYVLIEYASSFENKPALAEVVTLMLNGDNKWRVLGYHFR